MQKIHLNGWYYQIQMENLIFLKKELQITKVHNIVNNKMMKIFENIYIKTDI